MDAHDVELTASGLVDDDLWGTLDDWVRVATVSSDPKTYPDKAKECRDKIIAEFKKIGVDVQEIPIEYKNVKITPLLYAECKSKRIGAPTVLLYSHYDVQPAHKDDGWKKVDDPFVPKDYTVGDDTRKYGRGAADDKSGIIMHLGVVKTLGSSSLPVNLKLIFEGEEESYTTLEKYLNDPETHDDRFTADLIVIADCGNSVLGKPTLTTTLRGYAAFDVEVHTLNSPVHSGMYGGPAPDAFMTLVRLLATLHDDNGDVAVDGLISDDYAYEPLDEKQFRQNAGMLDGIPLIGTRALAQRLGSRPAINVTGLDGMKSINDAANVLCPKATARISVRLAPSQEPEDVRKAIENHLDKMVRSWWGIKPSSVTSQESGAGFKVEPAGKYFQIASQALSDAYGGQKTVQAGAGGSIPLVNALKKINPRADVVLWGCEEPQCNIHGTDESVSKNELIHMIDAETRLLRGIVDTNGSTNNV